MIVVVGSTNPVKVEATENAFSRAFNEDVEVRSVKVDSGVRSQPVDEEVMIGAMNRAKMAMKLVEADFSVGIEGGLFRLFGRYFCAGFVVVMDRSGRVGTGTSGWFECPEPFIPKMLAGEELGEIMAEISGDHEIKRKIGAIGFFTRGAVSRSRLYEHGVLMALAKFIAGDRWPQVIRD